MKNTNRSAFSLIELLTVSAIISILVAMVGLAAHSARVRAYKVTAHTEAQQFAAAFKAYWVIKGKWPSNFDSAGGYNGAIQWSNLKNSGLMGSDNGAAPFLEIEEGKFDSEGYMDPWGRPYKIKINPQVEVQTKEVYQVIVQFANSETFYYRQF